MALMLPVLAGAQSLTVTHLSETHTMIQVNCKDRYIMLPVQETAQEATVKVLSNGQAVLSDPVTMRCRPLYFRRPLFVSAVMIRPVFTSISSSLLTVTTLRLFS